MMTDHDGELSDAFDGQAAQFERAPFVSDPAVLARLVQTAALPPEVRVLDCGCGPGLLSHALLAAGHRVVGVDLSAQMLARASARCAEYRDRIAYHQTSLFASEIASLGPFDATISRFVLHHVLDPVRFVRRQVELLRPGGVLVLGDHVTDPDPALAEHHQQIETARDRTHTRNLSGGQLVELLASCGLTSIRYEESDFPLDFDDWFDRGTPSQPKEEVRQRLLSGPPVRGFRASPGGGQKLSIAGIFATLRAVKAAEPV